MNLMPLNKGLSLSLSLPLFHSLSFSSSSSWAPELEFFSYCNYTAVSLGNHEFDATEQRSFSFSFSLSFSLFLSLSSTLSLSLLLLLGHQSYSFLIVITLLFLWGTMNLMLLNKGLSLSSLSLLSFLSLFHPLSSFFFSLKREFIFIFFNS